MATATAMCAPMSALVMENGRSARSSDAQDSARSASRVG